MTDVKSAIETSLEAISGAMDAIRLEVQKKDRKIRQLEEQISLSSLFKQVNTYMGSILDFDTMLDSVDDVLAGVMGVSACAILVDIGESRYVKENVMKSALRGKFDTKFFDLSMQVMGIMQSSLVLHNLEKQPFGSLLKGSLGVYTIRRGNGQYGLIAVYYEQPNMMSKQREEFFELIAAQLSVYFENARLFTEMREIAITDGLTQLRNRDYLDSLIKEGHYTSAKTVGVIILDLDNFKKVNDTYGHAMGDEVLRVVGRILREETKRYGGRSFRYGGEKLISTFQDTPAIDVAKCAKTILARIRSEVYATSDGTRFQNSASFGISTEPAGTGMADIIGHADEALYEAKHTGKSRVVAYRDPVLENVRMSVQ